MAKDYKSTLDWSATPELEIETFSGSTTHDALNRPITATSPDGSVYRPTFNEANLLEKVDVNLRGGAIPTSFVANIDYDARGQRVRIEYGNQTRTDYVYDDQTFRLTNLKTTRATDNALLQDLTYAYDPTGNITQIRDNAQQSIYFNNQVVLPRNDYAYDATYRLTAATGREHIGQLGTAQTTSDDTPRMNQPLPTDGKAMRNYTEQYDYDAVGNFLRMMHQATNGNWTRAYAYHEPSLLEPTKNSNRLSSTTVDADTSEIYPYDAHGNMLAMSHLSNMNWDFTDQLKRVSLGGGGEVFYLYDSGGQRIRKVLEKNGGALIEERIYLGGFEIYRKRLNGTLALERETLHVMDDKQRIALVETRTQGADGSPGQLIRFQFGNHLGSASLELDDQAKIISYEEYYPYGSTSYQAADATIKAAAKRYRYTGMERDEETGLNYHTARYCALWLGRWVNTDPKGLVDGVNLYQYVRDSPVVLVDPAGTDSRNMRVQFVNVDDLPQSPQGAKVVHPVRNAKNLSQVTINDLDASKTTVTTMDAVRSSPDYVDNEIVSAGAEVSDLMYLNLTALNFSYTNKQDVQIPIGGIDFQSKVPSYEFIKSHGVIYPVSQDGNIALNEPNTPTILKYAAMKERDRSQALITREEYSWVVYAFSEAIKQLGHASSSVPAARFGAGQLVTRNREIGAGSNGKSSFNPHGGRQNCVNCTSAFLNSIKQKQLETAGRDVALNGGSIPNAIRQIRSRTGAVFGSGQYRTLRTGKSLQFFVVFPGSSKTSASHVLIGINNGGRTMIYDPQSHGKFFDIDSFGPFTAYPVVFPNGD